MTLGDALLRVGDLGYETDVHTRRAILDGARHVYYRRRWPWRMAATTIAQTAGATTVVLPSDFLAADALRLRDGTIDSELVYTEPGEFYELEAEQPTTHTGKPERWTIVNGLDIWPTPDRAYTLLLHYVKKFPTIATDGSADSTELPGPKQGHEIAVWLAAIRAAHRERQPGQVQAYREEADRAWAAFLTAAGVEQRQSGRHVVRSGFFGDDDTVR